MKKNSKKKTLIIKKLEFYTVLSIIAIFFAFPLYWVLVTSFKSLGEVYRAPFGLWPHVFTLESYQKIFSEFNFDRYFANSLFISLCVMLGNLIVASCAAFAFARVRFPGRKILFRIVLVSMMIPPRVTLLPSYMVLQGLGWVNSYQGLITPGLAWAFGVFLLRQFFISFPQELEDAAQLDGCGKLRFFVYILLPTSKPILATFSLLSFIGAWNSFLWPLMVISSQKMWTLPLALSVFQGQHIAQYPLIMSGAAVMILPIIILFIFVQKYYTRAFTLSGLKF